MNSYEFILILISVKIERYFTVSHTTVTCAMFYHLITARVFILNKFIILNSLKDIIDWYRASNKTITTMNFFICLVLALCVLNSGNYLIERLEIILIHHYLILFIVVGFAINNNNVGGGFAINNNNVGRRSVAVTEVVNKTKTVGVNVFGERLGGSINNNNMGKFYFKQIYLYLKITCLFFIRWWFRGHQQQQLVGFFQGKLTTLNWESLFYISLRLFHK